MTARESEVLALLARRMTNAQIADTLFMVANEWSGPENIGKGPRTGVVYMTEVAVPAAGSSSSD